MWEAAGIVGINPGRVSMRRLLQMTKARQNDLWWHTASVIAVLVNAHRDRRNLSQPPSDFHPETVAKRRVPAGRMRLTRGNVGLPKGDGSPKRSERSEVHRMATAADVEPVSLTSS